jgi:A/G-specific adenine glycosylase
MMQSQEKIKAFQERILCHYKKEGRILPWRSTTNPYHIFVSEIMLQQTQVERVIPKYNEWINNFQSPEALAKAPLSEVLKIWSGLGYNSRAKRLQEAAKIICEKYQGKVPETVEELISLPGIGPYTARSVLIFAHNKNIATVDTNIRRILIHEFALPKETADKELFELATNILPKNKSRDWHNALMDYGATILTSKVSGIKPKSTQSTFKESRRFYRGQIIKHLTKNNNITLNQAKNNFPTCKHNIETIFDELLEEGLIVKKNNCFSLP